MDSTNFLIIYLYSYLPAILLCLFFWWMDRFAREPLYLILFAFCWGSFGAGGLSYFLTSFFHILIEVYVNLFDKTNLLTSVLIAPFIEELTKGIFILFLLSLNKISNFTDGILFGIVIGLGFAAGENVYYAENIFSRSGEIAMWNNLWFRELHTTLLHASATAVLGVMIAYTKYFTGIRLIFTIINGFVLAIVTHGFWNFMAYFRQIVNVDLIDWIMRAELLIIFTFLLVLFFVSLRKESQIIIAELLEEHERGILPKEHIGFLASFVRSRRKINLPTGTHLKDYITTSIQLAFKKHEFKYNPSYEIDKQIKVYRKNLKQMSGYAPESLSLSHDQSF